MFGPHDIRSLDRTIGENPVNILLSTTSNWNPGDDFIRYGVKNLLNETLDHTPNYIHYDRNPDYFAPGVWEMGSHHKSNIMNDPIDWENIDMVVLAGGPEFVDGPLKPLYTGLKEHPKIPLIVIGVGYSHPVQVLSVKDYEKEVLSRDNTLIITRQYDLKDSLNTLLNKEIHCLPCPALFATHYKFSVQQSNTLIIPQASEGHQAIKPNDVIIPNTDHFDYLCHYIEDLRYCKKGYFSSDPRELLEKISQYGIVVSNRLHGGIVALGTGADVQIINSSIRAKKALEPYKPYLKDDGWYSMTREEKIEIRREYIKLLNGFLNDRSN